MSRIFCRIVAGDVPAEIVAKTEDATAFLDVQPLAEVGSEIRTRLGT
jgi:diadenosine tetraphosphate (Ap4A) HIT family hydrolase